MMKKNLLLGIVIGIFLTLFVEMSWFVYNTFSVRTETSVTYNPAKIYELVGKEETTKY